jgi:Zn-dependent M28 family amino/carboxypeptidase
VVGAHYDKVSEGDGVADNWSGASLLPALYADLASTPRKHTYRFVAFTDEEIGLVGSTYYVRSLGRSPRRTINAMVNLDVLGLEEASAWITRADRALYVALGRTALALKTELKSVEIGNVTTDSEAFRIRRIPAITITSVDPEKLDLINGANDTLDLIDLDRYYATYRLVASFLLVLDDRLDDPEFGKE